LLAAVKTTIKSYRKMRDLVDYDAAYETGLIRKLWQKNHTHITKRVLCCQTKPLCTKETHMKEQVTKSYTNQAEKYKHARIEEDRTKKHCHS
jgi:hypothetical protein